MPLIKSTTTTTTTTATTSATLTATVSATATTKTSTAHAAIATSSVAVSNGSSRLTRAKRTAPTTLAKSVPVTPVQPKHPTADFTTSSPEDGHAPAAYATSNHDYMPHSYPNFTFDLSDDDDDSQIVDEDLELDDSSLAMITPPPPYVDAPLTRVQIDSQQQRQQQESRAATAPPLAPTRKSLFYSREIFNINTPITPSGSSFASAITPTKLSAAAAAMFAAPQMVQLNRKWTQLHRKRRRRNSSSGDSKELDKLVLQSVDWDENDIY